MDEDKVRCRRLDGHRHDVLGSERSIRAGEEDRGEGQIRRGDHEKDGFCVKEIEYADAVNE